MINYYVKKLVSLNPDRYDYIEKSKAISGYYMYLQSILEQMKELLDIQDIPKTFQEWLETEI